MKPFVIVGTGGLGREILGWIAGCREEARARFHVEFFISEGSDAGTTCHDIPVLHPENWGQVAPRFIIAVADPVKKKRLAKLLEARGWQAETWIHDSAVVGLNAKVGAGTIVGPFCRVSTDCVVGEHVLINGGSGVGHDATVGDYSSLLGSVSINGSAAVGEGVLLGAGSSVYPGKRVGNYAKIGLGSVVLRNVPDNATMFGNPARRIDSR